MSTALLDLSVTLNVTVGALPGAFPETFRILVTSPGSAVEFAAMRCAPGIEASKSVCFADGWQPWHWLSSICGRLTWLAPVAKFTSSWQDPHAATLGFVFQLSACLAPAAWQVVQFLTSCGKTTVEKSDHAPRCQSEERRVGKECRSRWAPY